MTSRHHARQAAGLTLILGLPLWAALPGCSDSPAANRAPTPFDQAEGDPEAVAEAKSVYNGYCAQCHARDGRGIQGMSPPARDLADEAWQRSIEDDHLRKVIREGGPAVGLSPIMTGADRDRLSDAGLDAMIELIRALAND